jgi:non-specific protein-tyrosine kinase
MEQQLFGDDFRFYFSLLWRWAWLIILVAILAGVATYFISQQMPPVYEASSTLMVNEAPGSKTTDYVALLTSERLTQTYAEMLVKKPVLNEVILRLDLGTSSDTLKRMITVQPVQETQLIEIKVEDTSSQRAAAIANEVGGVFSEQIQAMQEARYANTKESLSLQLEETQNLIIELESSLFELEESPEDQQERDRIEVNLSRYQQTYATTLHSYEQIRLSEAESISNVFIAEQADPPKNPIRPRILTNTALASVLGAMIAVAGILLIDALDDTIRDSDEVDRYLKMPVLGVIRKIDETSRPVTAVKPRAPVSEDFRSLRTNIQFASVDYPLGTILVTSPAPADGKTTVSVNLSIILTQGGRKVSLVDADLRRPAIHEQLGLNNRWGLTSLFMDESVRLDSLLRKNKSSGLSVMTSGKLPPNPAELLGSDKMMQIISKINQQSDVIIFDSPPLTVVTDAAVLSKRVDAVILVINSGRTKVAAAQRAVEQLSRVGANLIGVVLNNVSAKNTRYYNTYYGYYHDDYFQEPVRSSEEKGTPQKTVVLSSTRSQNQDSPEP